VFNVPQFSAPVSQKTFFKGDKVQLKWNELGTSLIVLAQTDVDKSNKSYYGETNMYILSANGGFDSRIQLGRQQPSISKYSLTNATATDKEGPIHDVSWSPNSKEFGVVYGYMPAKTTIFNARAVAQHSFDLGPRNTIIFSPHGRFVIVAGFGNLAGQMDIYDLEKGYSKVTTIQASNASVCEWSPDGKHILTATTSPRLRVDNGIRLWHVTGNLMYNEDMVELYHVCWRPQETSELPLNDPLKEVPTPHASAQAFLSTQKTPSKPVGAYRPPGARGTSTPLHFKREDEGGAAFVSNGASSHAGGANGFGKPRQRHVPGAEPEPLPPGAAPGGGVSLAGTGEGDDALSKNALKNKKKREAKKAKEAAEKAATLTAEGTGESANAARSPERRDRRSHSRSRSKGSNDYRSTSQHRQGSHQRNWSQSRGQNNHHQRGKLSQHRILTNTEDNKTAPANAPTGPSVPAPDVTVTSPGGGSPQEKKIRSLLKKIRAIEDLKMRQAGGEKLEDTQIKKIATEDQIRREIASLGYVG
jgi:translation initiation factor 2A